jgi:cobalt transporter subunit CbtB
MDAETRPTSAATPASVARTQAVAAGAIVLLFGSFMLFGVGFAQPETIHNAAHDTRHSFTFPCH